MICPNSQAATTRKGRRPFTILQIAYTPNTAANKNAEKCEQMASHKHIPDPNIRVTERRSKARSSKYAEAMANARKIA